MLKCKVRKRLANRNGLKFFSVEKLLAVSFMEVLEKSSAVEDSTVVNKSSSETSAAVV